MLIQSELPHILAHYIKYMFSSIHRKVNIGAFRQCLLLLANEFSLIRGTDRRTNYPK